MCRITTTVTRYHNKFHLTILQSPSLPISSPWQPLISFLTLQFFFERMSFNGDIQQVAFVAAFFHLVQCIQDSPMLLHLPVVCYFLFLSSIPLYPFCLFTSQAKSIWLFPVFGNFKYSPYRFCDHKFSFHLDKQLGDRLLGCMVNFLRTCQTVSQMTVPFYIPTSSI